jgi:very-short-patch-repair endonuclease
MKVYDEAKTGAVLRARQLRRDSTTVEKMLWDALRETLPQFKWRRQMPVGPYFADISCFAEKLIIELDGGQHAKAADYDRVRTSFLQRQGYRVLRFWNNDVVENIEGVVASIADALSSSPSRRCAPPSLSQGRG